VIERLVAIAVAKEEGVLATANEQGDVGVQHLILGQTRRQIGQGHEAEGGGQEQDEESKQYPVMSKQ
jgi:hypothetical protein